MKIASHQLPAYIFSLGCRLRIVDNSISEKPYASVFGPEYGGCRFYRTILISLLAYTASRPRRLQSFWSRENLKYHTVLSFLLEASEC